MTRIQGTKRSTHITKIFLLLAALALAMISCAKTIDAKKPFKGCTGKLSVFRCVKCKGPGEAGLCQLRAGTPVLWFL